MAYLRDYEKAYEDELRNNLVKSDNISRNRFFEKFNCKEALIPNKSETLPEGFEKYRKFREEQIIKYKEKFKELDRDIKYQEFFLNYERNLSRKISKNKKICSTEETRYRINKIKELEREKDRLVKKNRESFMAYYENILDQDFLNTSRGRLVDVEYVLQARKKVQDSLTAGIPVYLVGHLGSGKTQIAEEAATDFTIKRLIQYELEQIMERFIVKNPDISENDAKDYFYKKYSEKNEYYRNLLLSGSKEGEKLRPLFISGSHNLTYEDMFVEKTLKLAGKKNNISYEDYLDKMITSFLHWLKHHENEVNILSKEEQLQLKIQVWSSFSNLLISENSTFGTVVEKIDREILIAMKEGRPVIIDEINTIAMQNLIALNDILQKSAGSYAYVTGVGPVEIKDGFCIIGTGNLSSDTVNYEGTNVLNPAFQSRFRTVEYNYIPQCTAGNIGAHENPEDNQLFRVIIEYLCSRDGTLTIPDPVKTLNEIYRFAQYSRVTQNIFEGKGSDYMGNQEKEDFTSNVLSESVLSIRNILHVMDHWNYGEEEDLSKALWEGFLSTVTNPDDLNFLVALAVRYGFFTEKEGWKIKARAKGEKGYTYDEIRSFKYRYEAGNFVRLSKVDIIHLLFGFGPKKGEIPPELKDFIKDENENMNYDEFKKINSDLEHLEHSLDIMKYIESNKKKDEK